ncbi:MAG TPA: hypothetical protein VKS21_01560 [Spirochaetota bacterium]|nr:hypothetical protein [Spirochaetota bacterium]
MENSVQPCPYLPGKTFTAGQFISLNMSAADMDDLLAQGYRHFGNYFFRPECRCQACIPLRIDIKKYKRHRSHKRLLKKNACFKTRIVKAAPDKTRFHIYQQHKQRFEKESADSFASFVSSFYKDLGFNKELEFYYENKLIALSFIDIGVRSVSAVYCCYLPEYGFLSPGKYSIIKEIELAQQLGKDFLYLGFYIKNNRHMCYKLDYYPCQLRLQDNWVEAVDADGRLLVSDSRLRGEL